MMHYVGISLKTIFFLLVFFHAAVVIAIMIVKFMYLSGLWRSVFLSCMECMLYSLNYLYIHNEYVITCMSSQKHLSCQISKEAKL